MFLRNQIRNLIGRRRIDAIPSSQIYGQTFAAFHRGGLQVGASTHDAANALLKAERKIIDERDHYFDLVVLDKSSDRVRVRDRRGDIFEAFDLVTNSYNDLEWVDETRAQLVRFVQHAPLSSCISRKIAGLHVVHDELRTEFAEFMGYDACVLGTNGYISQISTIFALFHRGDVIFSDQHNHSSLVDGCRLSHARVVTFPHRDYDRLESLLREHRGRYNTAGILSDGVFSTKGSVADLDRIGALARKYGCISVIDDTHGVGVLGAKGRGVLDLFASRPDVLTGGFGKAFGSFGGFALANRALGASIDLLGRQNVNSSFMSPLVAAQALYNFRYYRDNQPRLSEALNRRLRAFNRALGDWGLACYADPDTHIHPVFCLYKHTESETLACFRRLLASGFLPSFFPPPVAQFPSLRFSVHRGVPEAELVRLAGLLGTMGLFVDPGDGRSAATAASPARSSVEIAAPTRKPSPTPDDAAFRTRFSLLGLLANEQIYRYKAFYDVKALVTRYDERTDYCNYGYWADGAATPNPSAALVQLLATRLNLTEDDVLLNVGSGTGQPDVDIARTTPVRKILGVNICAEQVEYANAKARDEGLAHRIAHRVLSADQVASLTSEGVTCVMCLESVAEMPDHEAVLRACMDALPQGGRLVLCDLSRRAPPPGSTLRRAAGASLRLATAPLFGDNWRSGEEYAEVLHRCGASDVVVESIGDRVYPDLCREAQARFPAMDRATHVPGSVKLLSRLNFWSLRQLHEWKQIDYVLVSARK